MDLKSAIESLEHLNDEHWTKGGKPDINRLKSLTDIHNLTRKMVEEAAPGYVRETVIDDDEAAGIVDVDGEVGNTDVADDDSADAGDPPLTDQDGNPISGDAEVPGSIEGEVDTDDLEGRYQNGDISFTDAVMLAVNNLVDLSKEVAGDEPDAEMEQDRPATRDEMINQAMQITGNDALILAEAFWRASGGERYQRNSAVKNMALGYAQVQEGMKTHQDRIDTKLAAAAKRREAAEQN